MRCDYKLVRASDGKEAPGRIRGALGGTLCGCSYYGGGFVLQDTEAGTQDRHVKSGCHCPHETLHPDLQL